MNVSTSKLNSKYMYERDIFIISTKFIPLKTAALT